MNKLKRVMYILAFMPVIVYALPPSDIKADVTYVTNTMINFRTSAPKTIFYILGDKQGVVNRNEKLLILDVEEVNTLFGKYYWLNVERNNPTTNLIEKGWIYGGESGQPSLLEEIQ